MSVFVVIYTGPDRESTVKGVCSTAELAQELSLRLDRGCECNTQWEGHWFEEHELHE